LQHAGLVKIKTPGGAAVFYAGPGCSMYTPARLLANRRFAE